MEAVNDLVTPWDKYSLIYAFPPSTNPALSTTQDQDGGHPTDPHSFKGAQRGPIRCGTQTYLLAAGK